LAGLPPTGVILHERKRGTGQELLRDSPKKQQKDEIEEIGRETVHDKIPVLHEEKRGGDDVDEEKK